jgi:PKD repeat protein
MVEKYLMFAIYQLMDIVGILSSIIGKSISYINKIIMRFFRIVFLAIAFLFDCHFSLSQICSKDQLPAYLQQGLVAYYPFCGNSNDASGNNFHIQNNGAVLTSDYAGNLYRAYSFNGQNTEMSIPAGIGVSSLVDNFTISFWIKNDKPAGHSAMHILHRGNSQFTIGVNGDNSLSFTRQGNSVILTSSTPLGNEWTLVTYTKEGSTNKLYYNGELNTALESAVTLQYLGDPMIIGRAGPGGNGGSYRFEGTLTDLSIYNRVLSSVEISDIFKLNSPCTSNELIDLIRDTTISYNSTPVLTVNPGYAQYLWNTGDTTNSINAFEQGEYTISVTDSAGCSWFDTTYLKINKGGILASDTLLCRPDTVTLSVKNLVNILPDTFSDGLVANYTFDGHSIDLSGNARHLQSFGVTAGVDRFGNANGALVFQNEKKNVTDYLEAYNSELFKFNNYTFSLWMNVSQFYTQGSFWDPSYQGIITFSPEWWNLAPAYNLSLSLPNNSQVGMEHWSPVSGYQAAGSSFGALQTGNWYHVTASYDGSRIRMYLNGQILDSSLAQLSYNGQTQFVVGARGDGAFPGGLFGGFNGSMDQLMIWERSLNSSEIQTLFEAQQGGITNQTSILWSTGDTSSLIQVVPQSDTTISVAIDKDGIVENYSIQLKVGSSEIFEPFSDSTFVKGKEAQLDAGSSYSSYLWNTGDTSATALVNKSGYYSVSIRTAEGCTLIDSTFLVLNTLEIAADDTILCGPSVTKLSVPVDRGSFKYVGTYGENDYFIDTVHRSWEMSRQAAIDQGMDLWVIDNQEENDSVYSLLPHAENVYANYWIGLFQDKTSSSYSEPSGGWQWVNGNTVTFSNWLGGEPNNQSGWSPGWEDYGIMWTKPFHGKWADHYGELQDPSIIGLFNVYGVAESPKRKYLWSTGDTSSSIHVTPTADTDYFLTINENGLTFSDTIAIKVVDPLIFNPFADTISVCSDSLLLDIGNSFSSIHWNTGDTTRTYTAKKSGFYAIQVMNEFGCIAYDTTYLSIVQAKVKQNMYSICLDSTITLSIDSSKIYSSTLINSKKLFKDLSLYLPFDGKVNDWSSNGNSVLYQQLNLTEDRFGKLNQAFNLSSNPIRVPHSPKISISDSFTFSLWYYPETEFFAQDILMKGYDPEPGAWWLRHHGKNFSENTLNFSHKSDDQVHQLKTLSPEINKWHHVVGVFAGNIMKIYIDGVLTDSLINTSISSVENISDLVIGTNQYSFYGKIDEVAIWQRALPHHEISYLNSSDLKIKWSTGDSSASINVQPNSNTHYVLSVSDGLISCSDTVTVTIVPLDKSLSNLDQDTICVGGSSRLQAGEGSSFIWLRNGAVIDSASSRIHTATAEGSYRVIVTNASGCSDTSAVINITERALPLSGTIASQHPSVCSGTNSTQLTLSGELGSIRWQISTDSLLFSDIPDQTGNVYTVTNLTSTRYYRVIATNSCGSDTSAVQTVVVNPTPVVSFTVNNATQPLNDNLFVFTNTTSVIAGDTYLWDMGNGFYSASKHVTFIYPDSGRYTVSLSVKSALGCESSAQQDVIVVDLPEAGIISGSAEFCGPVNSNTLSVTGSSGTLQWQQSANNISFSNINTATSSSYTATNLSATTYFRVIASKNGLFDTSGVATITVNPKPTVSFNVNNATQVLTGNSFVFTNTSTGGSTYLWRFGNGATAITQHASYSYTTAGSYVVRLVVTSAAGCQDSTSTTVTVTAPQPPVAGQISGSASVCGAVNSNTLSVSGSSGILQWQQSANNISFSNINSATSSSYTATNLSATTYFRVIASRDGLTDTSGVATITVNPKPTVSFTVNNASQVLTGNSFVFTNTSTGGNTYLWRFGNGATATTQNATYSYAAAGSYVVRLVVTSAAGCRDSSSSTVTVTAPPPPPVAAGNLYAAGTTCAQFNAQTGSALNRLCYTVSSGRVSAVTPSSFMYYVKVTAQSASFTVNISQTVSRTGFRLFTVNTGGSVVNGDNCARVTSVSSPSTGQARASITRATVGRTYIIGVRYDTRSLVGYTTNGTLTANYTFVSRIGNSTLSNSTSTVTLYPNNCVGVSGSQLARMPELGGLPGASAGVDKTGSETRLAIRVYPNPSNNRFNVLIDGSDRQTKGVLRVLNAQGQMIEEIKDVKPGTELQLGMKYTSGTYTAVFIQGNQTTRQRMVRY